MGTTIVASANACNISFAGNSFSNANNASNANASAFLRSDILT